MALNVGYNLLPLCKTTRTRRISPSGGSENGLPGKTVSPRFLCGGKAKRHTQTISYLVQHTRRAGGKRTVVSIVQFVLSVANGGARVRLV